MRYSLRAVVISLTVSALPVICVEGQVPDLQTVLSGLTYRPIGPAVMGGRIADLAVVESKSQVFYVGAATGGVWKTENHGTSWTPVFDHEGTGSIGDVTVYQANPNVVWVGTGEPQNRQSSPWGNGVYKSTDAGRTWTHMGLTETKHVGRIVIHPRNPDVVYVAAVGHLWGPNEERGVYRTRDGGRSWEKVLYIDENTGAIDLAMDPGDPNTIFAAMYQRRRTGWGFNGGGPGSGLYRTVDGGDTWQELTEGLPDGDKGRIGVAVYRGDGNVVYALIEADPQRPGQGFGGGRGPRKGGTFRSLDRGDTWEKMSDTDPRPMYYSQIRIDPTNPDRIYVLDGNLEVSDDGGRTFRDDGAPQIHVDHHALWIDPNDPDHLIIGSDGGVSASWDGTAHWRMFDNIPLGQFYKIGLDMRDPYYVCGGLQDNDSWCGPSDTRSFHGIRNQDWYEIAYGDGFASVPDSTDSTIVYSESQDGNLVKFDLSTGEKTAVQPIPGPRAEGDTSKAYRFNWDTPVVISPHDPATVYIGANYLLRTRDRGMSWEEVGGVDLTKQIDRDTLSIMGVPGSRAQMSLHDGTSTYGNLTAVAESPVTAGLIYAGTDDGNVQVSRDAGATWTNVVERIRGLPPRTYVTRLVPSAHVEGRVYATFDGHRNDDYAPYVFVSENYGRDWQRITDGLPNGWSVNVIVEHPRTPSLLFVGNEIGVFVSIDRGQHWTRVQGNLPDVPVDDILIHPRENDLVVGTHGRSIWILADVTPLERLSDALLAEAGHIFPIRASTMWSERGDWPFTGATFSAPNPPRGARIRYYLRDPAGDAAIATGEDAPGPEPPAGYDDQAAPSRRPEVEDTTFALTVSDAEGRNVRTLHGAAGAGIHEVIWDYRFDAPYQVSDSGSAGPGGGGGGGGFGSGPPSGPRVMPGTYTVSMTTGGNTYSSDVVVRADPRRPMTMADREARQEALLSLHELAKPVYDATRAAQRLNRQFSETGQLLAEHDDEPESLSVELDSLKAELSRIRDGLGEIRRNTRVASAIDASSTRPTDDQRWQVDDAWSKATDLIERLNDLIEARVPAFHAMLNEHGIRPDPGKVISVPRRPS